MEPRVESALRRRNPWTARLGQTAPQGQRDAAQQSPSSSAPPGQVRAAPLLHGLRSRTRSTRGYTPWPRWGLWLHPLAPLGPLCRRL